MGSDPMVGDFIGHHFPLVTSTSLPSAFVFSGAVYWERPQFLFPGVTEGKIEVLLADSSSTRRHVAFLGEVEKEISSQVRLRLRVGLLNNLRKSCNDLHVL